MRYFCIFFKRSALDSMKMTFIYFVALLAIVPNVYLVDRWGPLLEPDIIESIFNIVAIAMMISLYQCANTIITEEKQNTILSTQLCAPTSIHHMILGKTLGITIAVLIATGGTIFFGTEIMAGLLNLGISVKFGFNDAISLFISGLMLLVSYALVFIISGMSSKNRHLITIALVSLPVIQFFIHHQVRELRIRHLGHDFFIMTWTVEYLVLSIIMLFCAIALYFLWNSKQRISTAETALE